SANFGYRVRIGHHAVVVDEPFVYPLVATRRPHEPLEVAKPRGADRDPSPVGTEVPRQGEVAHPERLRAPLHPRSGPAAFEHRIERGHVDWLPKAVAFARDQRADDGHRSLERRKY